MGFVPLGYARVPGELFPEGSTTEQGEGERGSGWGVPVTVTKPRPSTLCFPLGFASSRSDHVEHLPYELFH